MNILIVAQHFSVCSARYATDAFTRLGHTVRHVGQPMGRNIWGMQVPQEYVWEPSFPGFFGQGEDASSYDAIIYMDSDPLVLNSHPVEKHGTPLVVWGVDNHVRDYRRPYFDHYFLAHRSVSVMDWRDQTAEPMKIYSMARAGGGEPILQYPLRNDMTWLPCAYDPHWFTPSPIPWEQRAYDVCMIGVLYPKRWELVNALRAAGLKVLAGTGLVYQAYRDAYQNSRVALVSSACGDLPIRLFEGAGMGCAVLYDDMRDIEQFNGFLDIGERYTDTESAVEMAHYLIDKWEYALSGLLWAAPHTWDARAQVIIDWVEARQ